MSQELKEHIKLHHVVSARQHRELADLHKAVADCHEISAPKLYELHKAIADVHQARAQHHKFLADRLRDVEPAEEDEGVKLQRLAKVLSGV